TGGVPAPGPLFSLSFHSPSPALSSTRAPVAEVRGRRRCVPYAAARVRAVSPSRRRRAASWPRLAFGQDVRELLIEIEMPVLRARGHGGVGALQEGLQGPRGGLEQSLTLRGAQRDADDALTMTARRPDADVARAGGAVKSL